MILFCRFLSDFLLNYHSLFTHFDKCVNKSMKEKEKNNLFFVDSECQLKGDFNRVPVHKAFFAKMNAHLRVQ